LSYNKLAYIKYILDDESDTATEGEEEIKAREIRKQEVCLRIPNISSATTDTGSDTEVIFFTPPKSIENSLNKNSESIINDESSKSIKTNINTNTFNVEESLNSLNTNFINNLEYTDSCSLNNNLESTNTNVQKCDVTFNNIITNDNIVKNASSSSLNSCLQNKSKNECVQEMENVSNLQSKLEKNDMFLNDNDYLNEIETSEISIGCIKNDTKNQSKINNISSSLKVHDDLIEVNDNIQLNSFTNDTNLSKKIIENKNYNKPNKLNMVTTEPYPKYTPTVEKAIKKYENKQPKKECIVM